MKIIMKIEDGDLRGIRMWDQFSEKLIHLVDAGFPEVTIDLGDVRAISSLALGTIVASHRRMEGAGHRLVVTNVQPELKRILESARLLGPVALE